tara:strand:+ start:1579 stop:2670 length:1092 start_codon:yes stop_codon:yes gene_type:complete
VRKSIIIAGGGTGGHLFPALAIGDAYKKRFPNSAIHFVGSRFGLEARILPENERPHTLLSIRGFMRGYTITALARNLLFPLRFCVAYFKSRRLLKRLSPVAVIGTGGYASGLPLLAAIHKGIPTVIHEQNSYPGVTTRWLSSRVNTVCISYEDARRHLKKKSGVVTGNPVREEIVSGDRTEALRNFGLSERLPVVGLLGGSQGALTLNRAMKRALEKMTDVQIVWQAGSIHQNQFAIHENERVKVLPFVDDMGAFYAAADVVISRAGALALAEIAACGKPSLLVPFAGAAGDHQSKNAESLRATGAAVVVDERELTGDRLADEVMGLLSDKSRLNHMSIAARSVAKPDAAVQIVEEIEVNAET